MRWLHDLILGIIRGMVFPIALVAAFLAYQDYDELRWWIKEYFEGEDY